MIFCAQVRTERCAEEETANRGWCLEVRAAGCAAGRGD